MADRYYVYKANGVWNDEKNWSFISGGPGGSSVPKNGDRAIFDKFSGSCYIRVNVEVEMLDMRPDYACTIVNEYGPLSIPYINLLGGTLDLTRHDLTFTEMTFNKNKI